jgi:hypothetical protein
MFSSMLIQELLIVITKTREEILILRMPTPMSLIQAFQSEDPLTLEQVDDNSDPLRIMSEKFCERFP